MFTEEIVELTTTPLAELWEGLRIEEKVISRSRARQLALLREIARKSGLGRPVSSVDVAAQLDVSAETAKALLATADATPELSTPMAYATAMAKAPPMTNISTMPSSRWPIPNRPT